MILVTGATGLLGNSVVRELMARGERVRVLVRGQAPRPELEGLNVEIVRGELNDRRSVTQAASGCSAVIHSAAMIHIGYRQLAEARRINVDGTREIVEACRAAGSLLIYVSTVDTLPAAAAANRPLTEDDAGISKTECTYVISKREAEAVVSEAISTGLRAIMVHPGLMLGPNDWKPSSGAMMIAVNKAPFVVAPRGTASACDARDVAAAMVNALRLERTGEHYILAGENIGYPELCERMLRTMHREKHVFRMGPVIPAAAKIVDLWNQTTGVKEGLFNGAAVAMGRLHHAYDSSKAEKELGYSRRPLDETLHDAWHWLREHFL